MIYSKVHIESLEILEGSARVTSREIEEAYVETLRRLGHKVGMLELLTGVVARRLFPLDTPIAELAARAGAFALESARIDVGKVDLLINTSVSKDYIEPSIASSVHGLLGLPMTTLNFDVSSACLGFINAIEIASLMIETGQIQRALIVNAENSRRPLEETVRRLQSPHVTEKQFRDEFATLTLGSGAVAMLLCHESVANTSHQYRGGVICAATQHNHLCRGWNTGMKTDAIGLLKYGVELGRQTFQNVQSLLGWTPENIELAVMHQVGDAHMRTMLQAIQLPRSKTFMTYSEYGNMGPAAIPITLKLADNSGRIQPHDRVALMGIGSGLNCAMTEIQW